MAQRKAILPGYRVPFVNSDGLVNPVWLRFLTDLHERTGGAAVDKVDAADGAAVTAQAAAVTAQTAADTAQATADDLENRFGFDFDLDLR